MFYESVFSLIEIGANTERVCDGKVNEMSLLSASFFDGSLSC